MLYTEKDKLWCFLKEELKEHKDVELYYQGHGWSNNFVVLNILNKDFLFKPDGNKIKVYCPDCQFKEVFDDLNVQTDINHKLANHVCNLKN